MSFRFWQHISAPLVNKWFSFCTPWRQIILTFLSKISIIAPLTLANVKKIPGNHCMGIFSMINFETLRFQWYQFRLDNNLFPCWQFMTSLQADYRWRRSAVPHRVFLNKSIHFPREEARQQADSGLHGDDLADYFGYVSGHRAFALYFFLRHCYELLQFWVWYR